MNTIETIINGAIGALTFGMWWHFISMKQIEEHNRKVNDYFIRNRKD